MKFETKDAGGFTPYSVTLTVETEADDKFLWDFFCYDKTIPEAIKKESTTHIDAATIRYFMTQFRDAILTAKRSQK